MGWKGESRRHSLSRKGIKTNIDQHKRLAVNDYVARGSLKAETIELRNFLDGYKTGSRVYEQEPFDDNHPYRRFFRLMMDGSYKGEDYYLRIKERVEETNGNEKKLRSIAIQISMDMLETEFSDISRSTIQKNVVDVFGKDAEKINEQLIDDLKDFAKAHEMKWAMNKASGENISDGNEYSYTGVRLYKFEELSPEAQIDASKHSKTRDPNARFDEHGVGEY